MDNSFEPSGVLGLPEKRGIAYFSRIGLAIFLLCTITTSLQYSIKYGLYYLAPKAYEYLGGTWWFKWIHSLLPMYGVGLPVFMAVLPKPLETPRQAGKMPFSKWLTCAVICVPTMYGFNLLGLMFINLLSRLSGGAIKNPLNSMLDGTPWYVTLLVAAMLAPIIEELIFRKLIIDRIAPFGDKFAILISALIFGLFHGNFSQFFYAFALGAIFGYVYVKTRNILYSIFLHMMINIMGSVIAPAVLSGGALEVLERISAAPESMAAGDLLAIVPLLLFLFVAFVMIIAGIVLFAVNIGKIRVEAASCKVEGGTAKAFWRSPGVILSLVAMGAMFVLSLLT